TLSGFSEDELLKLLKGLDARDKKERIEHFDLDAAMEAARAAPRAQRGEIWLLGDHRLMCGDSTNVEDVERLFGGAKAALMATDPPYLVDYDANNHPPKKGGTHRQSNKTWDDYHDPETSVEFFKRFIQAAIPHLLPKSAIYQWHATLRQHLVMQAW